MRYLVPIAIVLTLPACATTQNTGTVATARAYVAKVLPYWTTARTIALALLPKLSADNQARVTSAIAIGDQAIADAQMALTLAEAVDAVTRANGAMAEVRAAVEE